MRPIAAKMSSPLQSSDSPMMTSAKGHIMSRRLNQPRSGNRGRLFFGPGPCITPRAKRTRAGELRFARSAFGQLGWPRPALSKQFAMLFHCSADRGRRPYVPSRGSSRRSGNERFSEPSRESVGDTEAVGNKLEQHANDAGSTGSRSRWAAQAQLEGAAGRPVEILTGSSTAWAPPFGSLGIRHTCDGGRDTALDGQVEAMR